MTKDLKQEIQKIIEDLNLECSVEEFQDKVDWNWISIYQKLSEEFIREFQEKVDWSLISLYQKLSESFIREFEDMVNWSRISTYQKLSENLIQEFQDKVDWDWISMHQKLSEEFIREFQDKVDWTCISQYQKLSEPFIKESQDRVDWDYISECQKLSKRFRSSKFKKFLNLKLYNEINQKKSRTQKIKEMKSYAKEYNLKFTGKYLYAYRDHDKNGCGYFNKTIVYEKNKYYRDWHCDMRKDVENSFGLGIFPKGNTKVRISIRDWGVWTTREDGKARVYGFKIV